MILSARLPTVLSAAVALLTSTALASSSVRHPLTSLGTLHDVSIDTRSHRVTALSSFDLSFAIHDPSSQDGSDNTASKTRPRRRVRLALEPNHDILSDVASVKYLAPDGTVKREEPVNRLNHKVYRGTAWVQELGAEGNEEGNPFYNAGTARIVIRRDGLRPLFEGSFSVRHDHHHIQFSSSYQKTKHLLDPDLPGAVNTDYTDDEYMVVYKDSDLAHDEFGNVHTELRRDLHSRQVACHADSLEFNSRAQNPIWADNQVGYSPNILGMPLPSIFKRQLDNQIPGIGNGPGINLETTIGDTSGCPNNRRIAMIGVATDCSYTASFDSAEEARENVITQINSASNLFENTFNIAIGLQNLTVSDPECPSTAPSSALWNKGCGSNFRIEERLNTFSAWRGDQPEDTNSHWTLLTGCDAGTAVGLAWLGQACQTEAIEAPNSNDVSTGANVVVRTPAEWQVIAHEIGHIFGAVHDCDTFACGDDSTLVAQQCCPLSDSSCDAGERFIMNPSTARGITDFSPCSVGNVCAAFGRNSVRTDCFANNRGVNTITGQQCGNGIVEEGEDCDCGGEDGCEDNGCCDPQTCQFIGDAVCDDSNESCCDECQFASAQTICRASTGACDPEERCSGESAMCPADETAPDGDSCTSPDIGDALEGEEFECASGQCTSRDHQCRTLMGGFSSSVPGGASNDTFACDSDLCQLSCTSPDFGEDRCFGLQQNFLDGTPCGSGGRCRNGICSGNDFVDEVGSWIEENKDIVIGVGSAVGGVLLVSILWCCVRSCRRRRARSKFNAAAAAAAAAAASGNHPPTTGPAAPGGLFGVWGGGNGDAYGGHNNNSRRSRLSAPSAGGAWAPSAPLGTVPPPPSYSRQMSGYTMADTRHAHARGSSGSGEGLLAGTPTEYYNNPNNSVGSSFTADGGDVTPSQQQQQQRSFSPMPPNLPMPPLQYARMSTRYA